MNLEYLTYNPVLGDGKIDKQETFESKTKAEQHNSNRGALICLFLLAYLIVANIGYNLWVRGKFKPIQKILTADVIRNLWSPRRINKVKVGTVVGILYSRDNPRVLINREIVGKGEVTNGVKIVKIGKSEVEFEKNGQRWSQKVLSNPDPVWETSK